jgi:O-antigen/teichoic acid export membrane protein
MVGKLGDGPFGVWAFVESLLAYFTLFDLGIAACVVRFVARFHATGDRDDLNRLISTALALFIGLGLLLFAVGAMLLPAIIPSLERAEDVLGFALLMLANLAITLPLSLFPSILDGLERFGLKSIVRIAILIVRTIGVIVVMEHRPSLWNLGVLFVACNLVEHALFAVLSIRLLPAMRLSWRLVDRATMTRVKVYSLHAFLAMVAGRTCVQSGAIIIGILLGAAPVTHFALASRLIEFAKALLRTATNTLTPAVSSLEAAGEHESIRKMFLKGTRWVLYLILPVQIGLLIFGRPFLTLWLGDPIYAERSYPVLAILSATLSLVIAQSVAARILYGIGKLKSFARAALLEAVANVLLSLLLASQIGLIGVAIGMAVPNLVMCFWVIAHTSRVLHVAMRRYFRETWRRPVLAAIVPATLWFSVSWPVNSWLGFAAMLGVGVVTFAITVLALEGLLTRFVATSCQLVGRRKRQASSLSPR